MRLTFHNLTIRNATVKDADQLCAWWNDGGVMAHAGFPNGLGTTASEIRRQLSRDSDEGGRRMIIEMDALPVGEMSYRNAGEKTAEIGIKICDANAQNKGYGTRLLAIFIDALFTHCAFERIILDTNLTNVRAQHVYEQKLGFRKTAVNIDSWRDQMGALQSQVCYEMHKNDWHATVPQYTKQLGENA